MRIIKLFFLGLRPNPKRAPMPFALNAIGIHCINAIGIDCINVMWPFDPVSLIVTVITFMSAFGEEADIIFGGD